MPEVQPQRAKEKKSGRTKGFFKSFVNVKEWVSYDELSTTAETTVGLYRKFFQRKPSQVLQETYAEAVARLGMNEEQQVRKGEGFLYSSLVYAAFTFGLLCYLIYLLAHKHFLASCLDSILVSLGALLAYREHFWYMQMRKKKLGCSFHDWMVFILRRTQ